MGPRLFHSSMQPARPLRPARPPSLPCSSVPIAQRRPSQSLRSVLRRSQPARCWPQPCLRSSRTSDRMRARHPGPPMQTRSSGVERAPRFRCLLDFPFAICHLGCPAVARRLIRRVRDCYRLARVGQGRLLLLAFPTRMPNQQSCLTAPGVLQPLGASKQQAARAGGKARTGRFVRHLYVCGDLRRSKLVILFSTGRDDHRGAVLARSRPQTARCGSSSRCWAASRCCAASLWGQFVRG